MACKQNLIFHNENYVEMVHNFVTQKLGLRENLVLHGAYRIGRKTNSSPRHIKAKIRMNVNAKLLFRCGKTSYRVGELSVFSEGLAVYYKDTVAKGVDKIKIINDMV